MVLLLAFTILVSDHCSHLRVPRIMDWRGQETVAGIHLCIRPGGPQVPGEAMGSQEGYPQ
jgi:hypothetical protein